MGTIYQLFCPSRVISLPKFFLEAASLENQRRAALPEFFPDKATFTLPWMEYLLPTGFLEMLFETHRQLNSFSQVLAGLSFAEILPGWQPAAIVFGMILALFCLLLRFLLSIPEAHAWDPQTHDKMTCYSLELLQRTSGKLTLLGWVLKHADQCHFSDPLPATAAEFSEYLGLELRRGSIEEDMNSHVINLTDDLTGKALTGLVGLSTGVPAAASKAIAFGFKLAFWKVSLTLAALAYTGYYLLRHKSTSLEGANGAYHFYNPNGEMDPKGLSEPVWPALLLESLTKDAATRPMPSALDRAILKRDRWPLDNEGRNYTVDDATRYYEDGFHHLAFYAMGRVIHLLQDMAVPAHVRDDSHLGLNPCGIVIEPSDPLEKLASKKDWEWHQDASDGEKWAFDPKRLFKDHRHASGGPDHVQTALQIWEANWERFRQPNISRAIFTELASKTGRSHYSYGTIPGNADSHDPSNTDREPLNRVGRVNWSKCAPNAPLLWKMLSSYCHKGKELFEATAFELSRERNIPASGLNLAERYHQKLELLESNLSEVNTLLDRMENCLKEQYDHSSNRTAFTLRLCLEALLAVDAKIKLLADQLSTMVPFSTTVISTPGIAAADKAHEAIRRYTFINKVKNEGSINCFFWIEQISIGFECLYLLLDLAHKKETQSENAVLQEWIDQTDQNDLIKYFRGPLALDKRELAHTLQGEEIFYPHGPCYMPESFIEEQYNMQFPLAVCYGALLLADWFENNCILQHNLGLGIWSDNTGFRQHNLGLGILSDNTGFRQETSGETLNLGQDIKEIDTEEINEGSILEAVIQPNGKLGFTLGFNHQLPAAVDLAMEIELLEDQPEEGYELSSAEFKLVKQLKENNREEESSVSAGRTARTGEGPEISGLIDRTNKSPDKDDLLVFNYRQKKAVLNFKKAAPYNQAILKNFNIPRGREKMGGIKRNDYEAASNQYRLQKIPGPVDQGRNSHFLLQLDCELGDGE